MAIRYTGGTILYNQIAVDTKTLIIENLKSKLVTAGWTSTSIAAYVKLTFTGVPLNNETCTFDGRTYTFKTVLAVANDILIGASGAACASNLFDAITRNAVNEGITFGTGTLVHATLTSSVSGAVNTISYKTLGTAGNGFAASEGLTNATLDSTLGRFGGYKLDSAITPANLQCRIYPYDDQSDTSVRIRCSSVDEVVSNVGHEMLLSAVASRLLEVIANKYMFFTWLLGSSYTAGCESLGGVPFIRDAHKAPIVTAVANSGGLFKITTNVAHGLTTGSHVYISGALGQTGINGDWTITVVDSTNYTLDGSTYAAGYTANSAAAAGSNQISRCFLFASDSAVNTPSPFSLPVFRQGLRNTGPFFLCLNQYAYTGGANALTPEFIIPFTLGGVRVDNFGGYPDSLEARITWPVSSSTAVSFIVGEFWNAFIVVKDVDMDTIKNSFDGHNWINFTHNYNNGSLWLAIS